MGSAHTGLHLTLGIWPSFLGRACPGEPIFPGCPPGPYNHGQESQRGSQRVEESAPTPRALAAAWEGTSPPWLSGGPPGPLPSAARLWGFPILVTSCPHLPVPRPSLG